MYSKHCEIVFKYFVSKKLLLVRPQDYTSLSALDRVLTPPRQAAFSEKKYKRRAPLIMLKLIPKGTRLQTKYACR